MTAQLDLVFSEPAAKGSHVTARDVAWMMGELRGRDWRTAADLGAVTESEKRRLRAIARESGFEIISGAKGYRLTREVNHTEFFKSCARLKSFADDLLAHIAGLHRVWHRSNPPRGAQMNLTEPRCEMFLQRAEWHLQARCRPPAPHRDFAENPLERLSPAPRASAFPRIA